MDVHLLLPGTLKLRNLSFLGSDRMDNLLKHHSQSAPEAARIPAKSRSLPEIGRT